MEFKNVPHPSQAPGAHQVHPSGTGMPLHVLVLASSLIVTGLTPTQETNNPYGRDFWSTPFYGYQNAPQQHQQDQWTAARNSGVFRQ